MKQESCDVVVIGGGLHGLSAALQIARRGRRVILLERAQIGRHASGASAAGVRTLGRHDEDLDLSLEACEYWHHIEDLVGDHCGYHQCGHLRLAETPAQLAQIEANVASLEARGYYHEKLIGPAEIAARVPALRAPVMGAIWTSQDGAADPHRTVRAFHRACLAAGVDIREGAGVQGLDHQGGAWTVQTATTQIRAEIVVNAAGAWGHHIAALAGETIHVETKASMMIATERLEPFINTVLAAVGRVLSFKQSDKGTLVIGGGVQGRPHLDQEHTEPDFRRLSAVGDVLRHFFPQLRNAQITRVWSGLESLPSDHLPLIGFAAKAPGMIHVFGFSGHGFQPVPAVGFAVADLATLGRTDRAIGLLSPARHTA